MPVQIGHILYSGIMPWLVYDGTAGAMLAPMIFAMLVLLGAVFLLAVFVITQARLGPVSSTLISPCFTDVQVCALKIVVDGMNLLVMLPRAINLLLGLCLSTYFCL